MGLPMAEGKTPQCRLRTGPEDRLRRGQAVRTFQGHRVFAMPRGKSKWFLEAADTRSQEAVTVET